MTAAGGSPPFDESSLSRRSRAEQKNTPAGPRHVRGDRLSIALSFGAIAIGITALTGYFLASASIAALSAHGKPVAAFTALALIVLGGGLLALRSPAPNGVTTARRTALVVVVLAAANLLWAALSPNREAWHVWAARGGVLLHSYAITTILILALGAALLLVTTRRDFAGHVIASMVLLICVALVFAYILRFPAFLDPLRRVAPVLAATVGLALISVAELLVRPRGWVVPLLSRTQTGLMTRVLLLATLSVPFLADVLRDWIAAMRWLDVDVDHVLVVDAVEVFFSAALVLAMGLILHKRESDRMRLASIVESSGDAIIGTSSAGIIETWNAGAEAMYGYTAAEARGHSASLLAPPERHDEASRILERFRLGEHPDAFETVRITKDGSRIDVWLRISPIVDDAGILVGASAIARDITRHKRAEEAMVESEARYRTLVENLPQKIVLKDRNSVYVSANEAFARDLGLEPKAIAGKTDYDFFPRDLASKYCADDARIMEAGVTEDLEEEYVEGGQRRFIQTVKTPVRDAQGNVSSILVILWDITAKRLAEDQLRKAMVELERSNRELARSEAALKEAQRIAQVGHWESSVVTGAVAWSDETYRILGIPIGSVTPSHGLLLGMMDSRDRRDQEDAFARALASSEDDDVDADTELRVTSRAGDALVLSQCAFVDRDDAGKVVGFHGTIQDITRRAATEQALRDSESSLAEAQEIAHIGSWTLDPEAGEGRGSAEAFRIFGIDPAPVIPMQVIFGLVHEDDRAGVEAAVVASFLSGTLDLEARLVTREGTRVVHAVARRRDRDEAHPIMIGTIQDVTDRRTAEEALRRSEAALRAAQRTAAVGHWEWSPVTGAVTWSDETYRILGISKESVEASFDLFTSAIVAKDRRMFEEVVAGALRPGGENDISVDLGITTPAGQALALSTRILLDRDTGGNVLQLHGTIQDVTRRVATEQALRDSEAALAEAQQIAHVGSAILFPETNEIQASDEYFRIFDLEPRPGTPIRTFLDRVHEEDRGAVKAALNAAFSSGSLDVEFRIVCGDGSIRLAHGIARRHQTDSPVVGLIGTVENVTGRKLAEEALRQHSESLERSNLELERFNRLAIGRELRMIELKGQVNDLCALLGQPAPYALPQEDALAKETS